MHALESNQIDTAKCEELCSLSNNDGECNENCGKYSQLFVDRSETNLFVIEAGSTEAAVNQFLTGCTDTDAAQFMTILESIGYREYLEIHGVTGCETLWKSQGQTSGDPSNGYLPYGIQEDADTWKEDFTEQVCNGPAFQQLAQHYCPVTCGVEACQGEHMFS